MKRIVAPMLCVFVFVVCANYPSFAVNKGDYQLKQSYKPQVLRTGVWNDLEFSGANYLKRRKNYRTLFCAKVHVTMPKKDSNNPAYIKVRFARHRNDGTLDTTGTNTWVIGKNYKDKTFHASLCWTIDTKYRVTAQVRVVGNLNSYVSELRQFKAWSPPYELPADMVTPAPK